VGAVTARIAGVLLPRTRSGRLLATGAAVDALGTGMFNAAATLYFVAVVGIPVASAGAVLAAGNLCGLLSPMPIGRIADRIGAHRVFGVLLVVRAVGYSAYALVTDFTAYLLLTCMLIACDRASAPLLQAVVGVVEGEQDRTRTMASIRSVRNIGMTVGFLLAGVVQAVGSRPAFVGLFVANGISFLAVALFVRRTRPQDRPVVSAPGARPPSVVAGVKSPLRDPRFALLTASEAVLALHDSVLLVLVPLWIVTRADAPASVASLLLAVNTVLTVALQVYVSRFAATTPAAVRVLTSACGLLVLGCAALALGEGRPTVVAVVCAAVAVVVLTVGENLHSVAGWQLSYDLAPPAARARYLAAFSLGHTVQRIVGPLLMTGVVLRTPTAGWLLLAALFLLALLAARAAVSRVGSEASAGAQPSHSGVS